MQVIIAVAPGWLACLLMTSLLSERRLGGHGSGRLARGGGGDGGRPETGLLHTEAWHCRLMLVDWGQVPPDESELAAMGEFYLQY